MTMSRIARKKKHPRRSPILKSLNLKTKPSTKWRKPVPLPPSTEPLEENCYTTSPLINGYIFVRKGDVYITRHCRSRTKQSGRTVYVVYTTQGKALGLRVPKEIYSSVLASAEETSSSRAAAVQLRDERDRQRAAELLTQLFPRMPSSSLTEIVEHAFLKGSGRVGRSTTTSEERKAVLAVEAHIRHMHTGYEALLKSGMERAQARKDVWEAVKTVKRLWMGEEGGDQMKLSRQLLKNRHTTGLIHSMDSTGESPRKRLKTDNVVDNDVVLETPPEAKVEEDSQARREAEVGITQFVSAEAVGFSGILKKRYTDFLVNEISLSGEVLHLKNTQTPNSGSKENSTKDQASAETQLVEQPKLETKLEEAAKPAEPEKNEEVEEFKLSDDDRALFDSSFGAEKTDKIIALYQRARENAKTRPGELGRVVTSVLSDRDLRTKIHQTIRRAFSSQLESSTDAEGVMVISVAANRNQRNGQKRGDGGAAGNAPRERTNRVNWDELGGQYLHFTLYKENKDTMEAISFIARQLRMNPKSFSFAGTKDRRAVTVQRACVHRLQIDRLAKLNPILRNAALGDFAHSPNKLELGDLHGNEFVITLRDCEITGVDLGGDLAAAITRAKEIVGTALRNLRERGYFNYYGLQRFGTFTTTTDAVGVKMLQGNFQAACEAILEFSPHVLAAAQNPAETTTALISSDSKARAEAIHLFNTTGRINEALDKLPRKFAAEACLIRHLGRHRHDYLTALQTIPRNLRLMYVHAYQSLVWNHAAGERWRLYGDRVVEGDLVIINNDDTNNDHGKDNVATDADGEVIITPQAHDSARPADDLFTRARPLTAAEAASGKYSIFDIVLPLPGFDVEYPANAVKEFYQSFMGSERGGGLDPFDMRRKWRDVSLSGGYRALLSRPGAEYSFDVRSYTRDDEQFVSTDMDQLKLASTTTTDDSATTAAAADSNPKLAVILKFQLGSSQYATMALRELMKGGIKAYAPDFGGR
ncbi:hypothetical protein ASPZODRAFT_143660 [Penicilliopsis zonata CBS 506.65]|uniref:TRUD domain-containing protein n=1 Tax=Penicilliopsis zonata CBS 506.65 TaxID=1073090 RepID=A0A1L9SF63_9EURO|nr:hypothetical protein ASPZODRAFT_143660 [Penicilliopsis zonata CBS 506.65]OJJ45778.1 hypothetical protein ASPZODRAFT_143660 [Penicilliopsis zonata CBS 506.65]